jgi:hypothetical protein
LFIFIVEASSATDFATDLTDVRGRFGSGFLTDLTDVKGRFGSGFFNGFNGC